MLHRALLTGLAALLPAQALAWAPTAAPEKLVPKNPLALRGPLRVGLVQALPHSLQVHVSTEGATDLPSGSGLKWVLKRDDKPIYVGYTGDSLPVVAVCYGGGSGWHHAELLDSDGEVLALSKPLDVAADAPHFAAEAA